jgi:hypothetical protein
MLGRGKTDGNLNVGGSVTNVYCRAVAPTVASGKIAA